MKIGILTFHCAHNYGAVLQCYALQEVLKGIGCEVEVINYRSDYLVNPYKWFDINRFIPKISFKAVKNNIKEIILLRTRYKRYKAFENFINHKLNLSNKVTKDNIPSIYDTYILGSDQIWSSKITNGIDPVFCGNFPFKKGRKKYIAYAASMEIKTLSSCENEYYKKSLNKIDFISVREYQLKALLQPLTGKKIETVLDPTILADSSIWGKFLRPFKNGKKYVVKYQVRCDENTSRIANEIARQIDAEVIEVAACINYPLCKNNLQCASPEEFLSLIKYSSCVVTTSFHGTVFSVIFNRPFYCLYLNDNQDSRSMSFLKNIGLENRMVCKSDTPTFTEIDYGEINIRIAELRNNSMNFLTDALYH